MLYVWDGLSRTDGLWLLANLFSGMYVFHYFVEAFIWKFRDPYYRKTLSPIYFPGRA